MTNHEELVGLALALSEESPCAVCQKNEWIVSSDSLALPLQGEAVDDKRLPVLPIVCKNCAHLRLFSIPQLQAVAAGLRGELSDGNGHF